MAIERETRGDANAAPLAEQLFARLRDQAAGPDPGEPIRMTIFGSEGDSTPGAGEDPRLEIDPPSPGEPGGRSAEQPPSPRREPAHEERVARLEELSGNARERLARLETKLDHVARDAAQWKWLLIGAGLTIVLAIVGTGILIQTMTVSTFQAAARQAQPPQQPVIINVPPPTAPAASRR
ncbi:MAG TPA: hypothetical protein VLK85_07610 [Ramlibacter sp.]|nr:hypothetical protein [Ramlibacter sp.]